MLHHLLRTHEKASGRYFKILETQFFRESWSRRLIPLSYLYSKKTEHWGKMAILNQSKVEKYIN